MEKLLLVECFPEKIQEMTQMLQKLLANLLTNKRREIEGKAPLTMSSLHVAMTHKMCGWRNSTLQIFEIKTLRMVLLNNQHSSVGNGVILPVYLIIIYLFMLVTSRTLNKKLTYQLAKKYSSC